MAGCVGLSTPSQPRELSGLQGWAFSEGYVVRRAFTWQAGESSPSRYELDGLQLQQIIKQGSIFLICRTDWTLCLPELRLMGEGEIKGPCGHCRPPGP